MNTSFPLRKLCISVVLTLAAPVVLATTWHVDCNTTQVQPADFADLHQALAGCVATRIFPYR